jgi:hypothetical protein
MGEFPRPFSVEYLAVAPREGASAALGLWGQTSAELVDPQGQLRGCDLGQHNLHLGS